MGSSAKIAKIQEGLCSLNFDHQDWGRVTAPTGLSIDSDSPEEIAVSIAAQILKEANRLDLK
jgi:xanthine dehydrogenase accessory factor